MEITSETIEPVQEMTLEPEGTGAIPPFVEQTNAELLADSEVQPEQKPVDENW